jgi:hypothetical protein
VIALPSVAMIAAEWARAKRAVMGTLGVGGAGGLGGHSRCGCDWPRRPRHRQRPDARSGARSDALRCTHRQHSGSTQAALTSTHEQSVALGRPTPSSSERALLPLPLTALPPSRPPFAAALALRDCMQRRAVLGTNVQRQQRAFARSLPRRDGEAEAPKAAAEKAAAKNAATEGMEC